MFTACPYGCNEQIGACSDTCKPGDPDKCSEGDAYTCNPTIDVYELKEDCQSPFCAVVGGFINEYSGSCNIPADSVQNLPESALLSIQVDCDFSYYSNDTDIYIEKITFQY